MNALISDFALKAIEQGILGLLLALGVACALIFILRWRSIGLARSKAEPWRRRLEKSLGEDIPMESGKNAMQKGEAGSAYRLARIGLDNAHLCPEALENLLDNQEIRERELLERGVQFLGTVGANAPFLGLTGTVLGILAAFRQMAGSGASGGAEVMSAIAGALIATAAGLIVAIPAVVLYNLLKARVRNSMNALREIRGLLLARSLQAIAKETF